jgi:hypothetical protein
MRDDLGSRALRRAPGAFLVRTQLVEVNYRWRPNLPDEGDNHVLELAVAVYDFPTRIKLSIKCLGFHKLPPLRPATASPKLFARCHHVE